MVDILEVKDWTTLKAAFKVDVKSLEDLKKIAEGYDVPFIFRRGKEYLVFCGHNLSVPLCYRFKG